VLLPHPAGLVKPFAGANAFGLVDSPAAHHYVIAQWSNPPLAAPPDMLRKKGLGWGL
jgi:hypothetical protein